MGSMIGVAALVTAAGHARQVEPIESVRVADGLNLPVYVTHAPGDYGRLFIVEKPGRIRILDLVTGEVLPLPFLDIDMVVGGTHEPATDPGLLGLAFHPDFQSNGTFYVHHLSNQIDTHIRRFQVSAKDPNRAESGMGDIIFTLDQPFVNHNGGWIGFGPDGYLYVPLGDGGSQHDPDGRAQDLTVLHGKILRLDVDGDDFPKDDLRDYAIPVGNPYVLTPEVPHEIWARGLRNPWRSSFDAETGDLYIGDNGQFDWEEIDIQPAASTGRENYGWRCYEATTPHNLEGCQPAAGMAFPAHEYGHVKDGGRSVIGGYVYRGCAIPSLRGDYLFADFISDHIWRMGTGGAGEPMVELLDGDLSQPVEGDRLDGIVSFGEDAEGELYMVIQGGVGNQGSVYRIEPVVPTIRFADLDCDGLVKGSDLLILIQSWGSCYGCPADLNGDGTVGIVDLTKLLAAWE